jgi:hypothetical protein
LVRPEEGATLVLALVFAIAVGLIVAALASLAGTNLLTTTNLQSQRNLEFAADGAVDASIQNLRFQTPSSTTNPSCPTYPSTGSFIVNGATIVVECVMAIPQGFRGRLVEFDACQTPGAALATCQAAAILRAEVMYNDVDPSSGSYPSWGAGGETVESWTVETANG